MYEGGGEKNQKMALMKNEYDVNYWGRRIEMCSLNKILGLGRKTNKDANCRKGRSWKSRVKIKEQGKQTQGQSKRPHRLKVDGSKQKRRQSQAKPIDKCKHRSNTGTSHKGKGKEERQSVRGRSDRQKRQQRRSLWTILAGKSKPIHSIHKPTYYLANNGDRWVRELIKGERVNIGKIKQNSEIDRNIYNYEKYINTIHPAR